MRHAWLTPFAILALALALTASPLAAAYVVYLKDGSTIVAREKYTIKDGRAIMTLTNGTQTFVKASEIDVARTDKANKDGYGDAVILPGDPRPIGPPAGELKKDKTLADLIAKREAAPRDLPVNRRGKGETAPSGTASKTRAGYSDFSTLIRKPYRHLEVASELQQFFRAQGLEEVEIHEGTRGDRPLVELTTNSEASVFRALTITANALLHIRGAHPDRVAAFELLMTTPSRERAGQFVLTPDMAEDLASKRVDTAAFFLQNVQF
jgi:hypothetical protein